MTSSDQHVGRRLLAGWVGTVRRFAWPILLLALLSGGASVHYTMNNVGFNADLADMLSEELRFRENLIELDKAFPQLVDNLTVIIDAPTAEMADEAAERLTTGLSARSDRFDYVFYPDAEPFFRRNGLLYFDLEELQTLSDAMADAQPLLAELSQDASLRGLTRVLDLAVEQDDSEVLKRLRPLFERMADIAERVAAGEEVRLSWREAMLGGVDSAEERRKFILVKPILDFDSLEPATESVAVIEAIGEELGLTDAEGPRLRIIGETIMFEEELRSVLQNTGLVGALSLILVVSLLFLGLRSWRLLLAAVVTLIVGLLWTAAFATAAIGELNIISAAFAVLFIGLSVDFGIHFSLRYREARGTGADHANALGQAAKGVGGALALSALAAAIGFFSFLPTAYRGVAELGLIAGAGMFIALFANLTVLPALLSVMPPPRPAGVGRFLPVRPVIGLIESHAKPVLAGALVLAVIAAASVPFAWFDDDPLNLRDPESESVSTLLALLEDPRVEPYVGAILAEDLDAAEALAERVNALPEVSEAVTLRDLVPENQDAKLEVIDDMALFLAPLLAPSAQATPAGPEERRAAARRLADIAGDPKGAIGPAGHHLAETLARIEGDPESLMRLERALVGYLPQQLRRLGELLEADYVEAEDLPAQLRRRFVAPDGQAQIEIYPSADLRDPDARAQFVDAVRAVAPNVTGDPVEIIEAGRAVLQAFLDAGLYAFALILLLLVVMLRSLRDTLLILMPLALAALLTVAATVAIQQPFNLANVIVLPLLMGLGVAFGIQMVLRHRTDSDGRLMNTSTPRAVVFSGLTTIGSFCALSISSHPGTASMGLLLTIAISLTMLSMLVVLPALLTMLSKRKPPRPEA